MLQGEVTVQGFDALIGEQCEADREDIRNRSAQMHSQGHEFYQTACTTGEACVRAARWAAIRMITPAKFLAAAKASACLAVIAYSLWVTVADVEAYMGSLDAAEWMIMRRLVGHELV